VTDQVDVLVIGGRCAGAPLATWLARAGARVMVADRATFPSDTLSTHVFQGGAIASLRRLGALERVLATGAPPVTRGRVRFAAAGDVLAAEVPMPVPAPGLPAMLCVRRVALDAVLHETAEQAGATMLDGYRLHGLVCEDERVVGARLARRDGPERTVRASVVVGADGRGSTVAREVGAGDYAVLPMERFGYFAYYEDVAVDDPPLVEIVRDERLYGFGIPADGGLYLACVMPPAGEYERFMDDMQANWEREVAGLHWVGERVAERRRVGRPRGLHSVDTFLRDAAGPGWALLGDAGHFKDPAPGQGIADALRQAERLSEAIVAGLGAGELDARLHDWWAQRDEDALERHTWAHGFGAAGPPPRILLEAQRATLARRDGAERFWGPSLQRQRPGRALGRRAVLRATAGAVARRRMAPTRALAELRDAGRRDAAYRRARRTAPGRRPRR
jgi:flavin-dependent dehydrogenase